MENHRLSQEVVLPPEIFALREANHLQNKLQSVVRLLSWVNYACFAGLLCLIVIGWLKTGQFSDMLISILCVFILAAARLHALLNHE